MLTTALALLRGFEGVSGAKRNKGTSNSNNDLAHGAGLSMANASDKPMAERECFGCGKKGHAIAECRKISAETKKELMSLEHFEMRGRLELLKCGKTASKDGMQHVTTEEAAVPEIETAEGDEDVYIPKPGLPTLVEPHKVLGYANANVAMQFLEEDLRNIDIEEAPTDKDVIGLGMVNPQLEMDIPHYAFVGASRKTLPLWTLFLDSCATYHSMFIE